jgi:hypothetical protein
MKEWVRKVSSLVKSIAISYNLQVYLESRGKELPGNYNHVLLSELFHVQSSRWKRIAEEHVQAVHEDIASFVTAALYHLIKDEHILEEVVEMTRSSLLESKVAANEELEKLYKDEELQQPITYNHYYTDNVQKSRRDSTCKLLRKAMDDARIHDWNGKFHFSNNTIDEEKLLTSLQKRVVVDMDDQACSEALAGLQAYYKVSLGRSEKISKSSHEKVAMKTYVDNVCRQVIERHLLSTLPEAFNPERIALLSDVELHRIAADSPAMVKKRKDLQDLHSNLVKSLEDLRK